VGKRFGADPSAKQGGEGSTESRSRKVIFFGKGLRAFLIRERTPLAKGGSAVKQAGGEGEKDTILCDKISISLLRKRKEKANGARNPKRGRRSHHSNTMGGGGNTCAAYQRGEACRKKGARCDDGEDHLLV